jgi:hypothetical protein
MEDNNTFTVRAVIDMDTLILQAGLLYDLSTRAVSMDDVYRDKAEKLLMGAAALLYHLHNGRFVLTEVREFSNREVY